MIAIIEMVLILLSVLGLGIIIGLKIEGKFTDEALELCQELNQNWYEFCKWLLSNSKKCDTCQDLACDGCEIYEGDEDNA